MNIFAKLKYLVSSIKTRCDDLTNVNIMQFGITMLIIGFLSMMGRAEYFRWEVYLQNKQINELHEEITALENVNTEKDSLLITYQDKEILIKKFVRNVLDNPRGWATQYYKTMSVTGYHPVKEQTDSTPDITADGTKIEIDRAGEYRYVAMSRDMLNVWGGKVHFGDYILINGTPDGEYDGIYQVRDTMNARHKEWIDILLTPGQQSFYYKQITMYKIDDNGYLELLTEIYDTPLPNIQPLAMLSPEV